MTLTNFLESQAPGTLELTSRVTRQPKQYFLALGIQRHRNTFASKRQATKTEEN